MSKTYENHWGFWIESRAQAIGIKRKLDLAKKVGCSRQQLSRWMGMSRPPAEMRMGLDEALCAALEVDKHALFFTWYHTDPYKLARTRTPPDLPVPDWAKSEPARLLRRDIMIWLQLANEDALKRIRDDVSDIVENQDLGPPVRGYPYDEDVGDDDKSLLK